MRLRLLGPLELLDDAGIVVPIATPKRRGVLIALALELNRAVSVDRLLTSVWGSEPPRQARSALHGHIAQLRKALDGNLRLVTQAPGYMLAGAEELVDVAHFQKLLDRAAKVGAEEAVPLLSAALALWRGPTLAGLAGDEFLQHAAALQEARLGALERLASALTEFGRAQSTIPALAQAVARHPLRESLVRVLMLALYQEGRQAEALAAYQRARERLAEDLGVDPAPELRHTYEAILRGSVPPSQHPPDGAPGPTAPSTVRLPPAAAQPHGPAGAGYRMPAQLPVAGQGFVDRPDGTRVLDQLHGGPGSPAIAVVVGAPGVGKTALAVHWAHRAAATGFSDGQLFADLRGYDEQPAREPASVLAGFLRALGIPDLDLPNSMVEMAALYRSLLAGRRVLIVLDNVASAAQVRPLLPASPTCAVLLTSRSRLDSLVAVEGATTLTLGPMSPEEALALLAAAVGHRRVDAEPHAARRLVELCDRLPLALRVAATRLVTRPRTSIEALVERLSDERQRLALLHTDDGGLGVTRTLCLSYRSLPDHAAHLIRMLGLHPSAQVDVRAASALTSQPVAEVHESFGVLECSHLLTEAGAGRYHRHDLVRLFSQQLAATELDPQARAEASSALLRYYLAAARRGAATLTAQAEPAEDGPPYLPAFATADEVLRWFEAEEPTIRSLVTQAVATGNGWAARRILDSAGVLYAHSDQGNNWLRACVAALHSAQDDDDVADEIGMLSHYAVALAHRGQREEAASVLDRAVRLCVEHQDAAELRERIARAYAELGTMGRARVSEVAGPPEPGRRQPPTPTGARPAPEITTVAARSATQPG